MIEKNNKIKIGDVLEGNLNMNASGSAYLVSTELPKDIYVHGSKTNKALHLDTVKVEVIEGRGRAIEGRVVEIVKRFKTEFVGVLQITERFAFLVPDSPKMNVDIFIPLSKLKGGKDGQKAVARLTNWKNDAKSPNGEIIEVLGDAGNNDVEIHSILNEYSLPYKFPDLVLDEANSIPLEISESEISKRKDFRNVFTCSIDGADAKDLDDALSVEFVDGLLKVGIHIADVTYYVRPNTELHKEAYNRGNSVYLVDRVVPMFPERLSNGLCSLNPHVDKLVFSFIFTLDNNGKILNQEFCRGVINSDYRLTYDYVQTIINGGDAETKELKDNLLVLDKYAKKLRQVRTKDSLSFNKREVKIQLDENAKPIGIMLQESNDAHKLIEEFMVLTNRRVDEFISSKGVPTLHRTHDAPDQTKINNLKEYIKPLGYNIKTDTSDDLKKSLNKLLDDIKGTPYEEMIGTLVVRAQQKAIYQTKNDGHWGMGLEYYVHVTSPIRRFCDKLVHQILTEVLPNNGYPIKI